MQHSSRFRRGLLMLAILAGFVLVPTAAQADPSFYDSPLFGVATDTDGTLLVADYFNGIVNGDTGELLVDLPFVQDMTPAAGGTLWAVTAGFDTLSSDNQALYKIDRRGNANAVADLFAYEETNNPHPFAVDSNPFGVVDLNRGGALVVDAGGNDLLEVGNHGRIKLVAVFPDELVSTANIKKLFGCPAGPPPICGLPAEVPGQAVPTSVAVGSDGAYYVGELKGEPSPIGESRIWRVKKGHRNLQCPSKFCTVALDGLGFTSVIDLAFGPDGRLYVAQIDDASWLAMELGQGVGGSVHACNLKTNVCEKVVSGVNMLTAITFRKDGSLSGTTNALIPGAADAVQLLP